MTAPAEEPSPVPDPYAHDPYEAEPVEDESEALDAVPGGGAEAPDDPGATDPYEGPSEDDLGE